MSQRLKRGLRLRVGARSIGLGDLSELIPRDMANTANGQLQESKVVPHNFEAGFEL